LIYPDVEARHEAVKGILRPKNTLKYFSDTDDVEGSETLQIALFEDEEAPELV
jgi:hypothetical protein